VKSTKVLPRFFAGLVVSLVLAVPVFALSLGTFTTEAQAQQHCPKDVVVWLNLPTMIWHYKGMRWYGITKHGAYACEKEAGASGARATRNGQ
jgi:NO-binding membrane sensor protein with MHYT domain